MGQLKKTMECARKLTDVLNSLVDLTLAYKKASESAKDMEEAKSKVERLQSIEMHESVTDTKNYIASCAEDLKSQKLQLTNSALEDKKMAINIYTASCNALFYHYFRSCKKEELPRLDDTFAKIVKRFAKIRKKINKAGFPGTFISSGFRDNFSFQRFFCLFRWHQTYCI